MKNNDNSLPTQLLDGYAATVKGKTGITRILKATTYSRDGLITAYRNEATSRQVTWLDTALLLLLIVMPFSLPIKMLLVFASFFIDCGTV